MRKHALTFIAITLLLDTVGFGLIIPVLPKLLVGLTGDSLSQAAIDGGWLAFVYAAMQFVCAPLMGSLGDRFGRRKALILGLGTFGHQGTSARAFSTWRAIVRATRLASAGSSTGLFR